MGRELEQLQGHPPLRAARVNADDVVALLRQEVQKVGSQAEYSRRTGVCLQQVNQVLNRVMKRPPTAVLNALGLKAVVVYEKK